MRVRGVNSYGRGQWSDQAEVECLDVLQQEEEAREQQQAEAAKNKAADGGGAEDDAKGFDMRPIEGLKELHEQEMTETR